MRGEPATSCESMSTRKLQVPALLSVRERKRIDVYRREAAADRTWNQSIKTAPEGLDSQFFHQGRLILLGPKWIGGITNTLLHSLHVQLYTL